MGLTASRRKLKRMTPLRVQSIVLVPLFATCTLAAGMAGPDAPGATETTASFVAGVDAWHARRLESLKAPDGWLSLVAFEWLKPGRNRVGKALGSEAMYEGFPAECVGTLVVSDDGVRFESVDGVDVQGVPEDSVVRTDADGEPTVLSLDDIRFYVIVRGGRLAVRIKDGAAQTRAQFRGIERYPVAETWSIRAEFVPAAEGEKVGLDTVIGVREEVPITGRARFVHQGVSVDAVLLSSGDGGSLLRFGDATNGEGTYGAGRYLYVEPSIDGATVVLDFNRAYNPPCAFTVFATCTIPPASNQFSFPVTAGERWAGEE